MIRRGITFLPTADAGGDGLLGSGVLLSCPLRRGFDAVRGLECLDLVSQFGSTWPLFLVRLMAAGRKSGFELVTKSGQFGEVVIVRERFSQTGLVITKLRFRDGQVLADADAF